MLDSQETKKLAIYKHDFSPRGIILEAVYYKGDKKCYTTGFSGESRPSDKGGLVGRGVKNKGEPPGPLPWIRHWSFFYHGVWYRKGFTVYCLQRINCEFIRLCFQLLSFLWKQRGKFSKLGFFYF